MKRLTLSLSLLLSMVIAFAANPVTWTIKLVGDNSPTPSIEAKAVIEPGYHLFSIDNPEGGSNPLEFLFETKGRASAAVVKSNQKV